MFLLNICRYLVIYHIIDFSFCNTLLLKTFVHTYSLWVFYSTHTFISHWHICPSICHILESTCNLSNHRMFNFIRKLCSHKWYHQEIIPLCHSNSSILLRWCICFIEWAFDQAIKDVGIFCNGRQQPNVNDVQW